MAIPTTGITTTVSMGFATEDFIADSNTRTDSDMGSGDTMGSAGIMGSGAIIGSVGIIGSGAIIGSVGIIGSGAATEARRG
ncbi:MAG: hypothetical protein ACREV1_06610 [Gammaproteobacteria bacterium]